MKKKQHDHSFPQAKLLDWYGRSKRDLPWRETNDPYLIWLSEIILQQTRVDQGLPYYERFAEAFPTIKELAEASEDRVLKLWEGLGYYSRARNLHFTAKYISGSLNGDFPNTHESLLSLKGVGPYTAAAIGSMAFGLPVAAVDGNVYRVIARYLGITESIDDSKVKKAIAEYANEILDEVSAGDHNQAMMELGATVCVPNNPKCRDCPLCDSCVSNAEGLQSDIPVRTKKTKVRDRFFYYSVVQSSKGLLVARREAGDIWQGLYEFPLIESERRLTESKLVERLSLSTNEVVVSVSNEYKHILSHQRIYARFVLIKQLTPINEEFDWVKVNNLSSFAFPRLINRYLEETKLC